MPGRDDQYVSRQLGNAHHVSLSAVSFNWKSQLASLAALMVPRVRSRQKGFSPSLTRRPLPRIENPDHSLKILTIAYPSL